MNNLILTILIVSLFGCDIWEDEPVDPVPTPIPCAVGIALCQSNNLDNIESIYFRYSENIEYTKDKDGDRTGGIHLDNPSTLKLPIKIEQDIELKPLGLSGKTIYYDTKTTIQEGSYTRFIYTKINKQEVCED